ncbi:MAG: MFS transporter [Chloroflexi bacterium]|nr:MFS transporter [Chloroflexota bacterium]
MSQVQPQVATGAEVYPRYRWVMVGLSVLTQEIMVLLPLGLLLPSMRQDLKFGLAQSGLFSMTGQLGSVLLAVPSSLVLVRFSPKWVYIATLFLTAIVSFITGQARTFVTLLIPYFFMVASGAMRQVPDTLIKLQWIPKHEFGRVMGITTGMGTIGQSVAAMVVPFLLLALGGWRGMVSLFSLGMFLLAIIWLIFARERVTSTYRDGMSSQIGWAPLKSVLRRKEIIMVAIAFFGGAMAYMNVILFLPTFLVEERSIPLTTVGFIMGMMPIGGVCSSIAVGFISDKIGLRKPTIWPAGLLMPFFYFSLTSPVPIWVLPILTFVIGFLAWAPVPTLRAIPFELPGIKPSEVAVGQSVIQTMMPLSGIIGAPIVGSLAESIGLGSALRIVCVFPLTMAAMGLLMPETGPKAAAKKAGEAARKNITAITETIDHSK